MNVVLIGASLNPRRYAYQAESLLCKKGHKVYSIGKKSEFYNIVDISKESNIHTVTLYIRPDLQEEYYNHIVNLNPKRVIFNPGTENPNLVKLLNKNDIRYEYSCTLVMLATEQF